MPPTILLVEDDSTARHLIGHHLTQVGFHVLSAPDGETALRYLADTPIDVVLTDIQMRTIDGLQVLAAARAQRMPAEVVLMTGYGSLDTAIAALRAGAFDYVLKPCDPEFLLASLNRAVLRRQALLQRDATLTEIHRAVRDLQHETIAQPSMPPTEPPTFPPVPGRVVQVGDLELDLAQRLVRFRKHVLMVTPTEYSLLAALARAPGYFLPYEVMVQHTHHLTVARSAAQALLKSHIRNLRQKLDGNYVVTIRGVGCRLQEADHGGTMSMRKNGTRN